MSTPLLMLDVDGVILPLPELELEADESGELWPTGRRTSLGELETNLRSAWGDSERFLPLGTTEERVYSPTMINALVQLVNDAHAHVVWHTSWVIWPEMLDDLIARLSLPAGVQLDGTGSHPRAWSRTKRSAIRNRIVAFREHVANPGPVVVIDDDARDWGIELSRLLGAEVIMPRPTMGMEPSDIERARTVLASG